MENLDCRKLFDIGAKIHLSSEFIEDGKINSLREDCINIQEKQGFLKVVDVTKDNVIVKGTTKNHYLRLSDIKLYQLGTCDNKYEILYAFANNQKMQGFLRNLSTPLYSAFNWKITPEKEDFWTDISRGIKRDYPNIKES